ncbi:MAG: hypothetical protein Q9225_002899 [Loekoesia sp. 1 TL-2023]
MAPGLPVSRSDSDSETLSTLPDSRSPLTSPELSPSSSILSPHPDLSNELATLNNKLIRAINHQTDLDDTLVETRHELDEARQRVKQLEAATAHHGRLLASGELVPRSEVERQKVELMENLAHEQKQRGVMEKDKRGMEQELESLTTALFEEANQMVAAARQEREAADRRSDQLRAQLNETELLLVSHQEQLAQLKAVMHQMSIDREGSDINAAPSAAPSTPAIQTHETLNRIDGTLHSSPTSDGVETAVPAPPTSFTHLLHPVLRTDLQAYDDFQTLLSLSRKSSPTSRVSSGSFSNLKVANFGHLAGKESQYTNSRFPSTGSTSSLSNSATCSSSPVAPSSTNSSVSSRDVPPNGVVLKETRFYKRALTEDIEPTLRLDTAPGLSWLARRTVVNSMSEGSLVVEPMPATIKYNVFACSLCGENRKDEEHARSHRFRTSESDNAQRYPLCGFCLTRVRASCDFLGFLRMLKDGHWRADDEESELQAWEECVRLRERMFWARVGGGVVAAFPRIHETPRHSDEQDYSTSAESDGRLGTVDDGRFPDRADTGHSNIRKGNTIDSAATSQDEDRSHLRYEDTGSNVALRPPAQPAEADFEVAATEQPQNDLHDALSEERQGLGIENATPRTQGHVARDSITMPGAFE